MYQPVIAKLFIRHTKWPLKTKYSLFSVHIQKRIIKWLLAPVNLFSLWPQCYCTCNDDVGRSNVAVLWEICRHILPHVLMAIAWPPWAIIQTNIWWDWFFSFIFSDIHPNAVEELGVEFRKQNEHLFLVLMKFICSFV